MNALDAWLNAQPPWVVDAILAVLALPCRPPARRQYRGELLHWWRDVEDDA